MKTSHAHSTTITDSSGMHWRNRPGLSKEQQEELAMWLAYGERRGLIELCRFVEEDTISLRELFRKTLRDYGFYELEQIKSLSAIKQDKIIEYLLRVPVPHKIAMLSFLEFINHLYKARYVGSKGELKKILGKLVQRHPRTVQGNIDCLSKTADKRYTAYKYVGICKRDYEKIKKGVRL
ncbi:MAG: hypothetical protein KF744_14450 [Taibaiella sp.]|nr:hypothetical protein [Taibaiella sp.]